jgi:hypothetical protein
MAAPTVDLVFRNHPPARLGAVQTVGDAAWILRERVPVDRALERDLARL